MALKISRQIAAYAAGLHDGEGCVFIHFHRKYISLRVSITNNDRSALEFVKKYFGGSIYEHSRQSEKHRLGYEWSVTNEFARLFLQTVFPYSIIKKRRVKLALEFLDFKKRANRLILVPHPSIRGTKIWKRKQEIVNRELKFKKRLSFLNRRGTGL